MKTIIAILSLVVCACSQSPANPDALACTQHACTACPACQACPAPVACPACPKLDALFYSLFVRMQHNAPQAVVGKIIVHRDDQWWDVAAIGADGSPSNVGWKINSDFPQGDRMLQQVRTLPSYVGVATVSDITYQQDHGALVGWDYSPVEGMPGKVFMITALVALE